MIQIVTRGRVLAALLLSITWVSASSALAHEPAWSPPIASEVRANLANLSFDAFVDKSYENYVLRFPESVTRFGVSEILGVRNDRLDNYSQAYLDETRRIESLILDVLLTYDRSQLSPDQQLIYDVYEWFWSDLVAGHEFAIPVAFFYYIQIPIDLPDNLAWFHPIRTVSDVEDYLCRLEQIDDQLDQLAQQLRQYAETGLLPFRDYISRAKAQYRQMIGATPYQLGYYTTLRDGIATLDEMSASQRSATMAEAYQVISQQITPAYRRFSSLLSELLPQAPDEPGLAHMPGGRDFYAYCLQHYTQSALSPEMWHEIGLREVEQAEQQLQLLAQAAGFATGMSPSELYSSASDQSDQLDGEAILDYYVQLITEAREKSGAVIGRLPDAEVAVIGHDQGGMYFDTPADGSRPAVFYAPSSGSRSASAMPLIAYHETYPGHHTQRMLADELGVPLLLQSIFGAGYQQGFVEGWGLYVEELTASLGWYDQDPMAHILQGYYELLRCVAVVVNTGIHALGWSFEQAAAYYVDTLGMTQSQADGSIYSAHLEFPGGYPGYKIGAMTFTELRSRAEQALGETFSMSEFHDVVLMHGALPLHILEQTVDRYIAQEKSN